MTETEEMFTSVAAGRQLHRWTFSPSDGRAARCGALLVHGWGDHIGCHRRAAELLVRRGALVRGVDWPGNGWSKGMRGHIGGIDQAVAILHEALADLRQLMEQNIDNASQRPLIFYAHSTGVTLGLKFLAQTDPGTFRGAWLSSPLVRAEAGQTVWKRRIARVLAKVAPALPLDTGVRVQRCRRSDPETGSFGDLQRCHPLISASFGDSLVRASEGGEVMAWAAEIDPSMALLMALGEDDTVCPPEYGRKLFEALPSADKTLVTLPGFRHEPLMDHWADDMLAEVEPWLEQNLS